MRVRLHRLARLGPPAVAVLALTLAGCSDPPATTPPAPTSSSPTSGTPTASSPTAPAAPAGTLAPTVGSSGSDGLTVRYLGGDGTVKTVRVEDFPR